MQVRRWARALVAIGTLALVAAASIAFALQVTPSQPVTALGQTVGVGATAPSWSTSGPGQVELFGQTVPTRVEFVGPVRPRLELREISIDAQVAEAFSPPGRGAAALELGRELAAGWRRYFLWQSAFVGLAAVVLLGAIAGWRRFDARASVAFGVGGLLLAEALNLGAVMVTAFTAPDTLRAVGSLNELVGRSPVRPEPEAEGPELADVQAVVMGDSTAAGIGGPIPPGASRHDEACGRSTFAFAETLELVNAWRVDNVACSGATIEQGILGPQFVGGERLPPQLALARRASRAEVVIVNVGANDLRWSTLVFLCGTVGTCDDRAITALFQRSLDGFTRSYYELLRQLTALPGDPIVLINRYYVPFGPQADCLGEQGLTSEEIDVLLDRLATLNDVLARGAETFGFRSVQPDFAGHELCTEQSYVQGADDEAPLHPNARGHLVIALADERALLEEE